MMFNAYSYDFFLLIFKMFFYILDVTGVPNISLENLNQKGNLSSASSLSLSSEGRGG